MSTSLQSAMDSSPEAKVLFVSNFCSHSFKGVGAKRHLVLSLPTHYQQREQPAGGDGMRVVKNANSFDQLDREAAKRATGGKHQRRVNTTVRQFAHDIGFS